jgi:hypothetical protein
MIFVHSGTGLTRWSTGETEYIHHRPHWSDGLGYTLHVYCPYCWRWKGIHPACPYCWPVKGIHPARPYCWRWKLITLHVLTAGGWKGTHSASLFVYTAGGGNGYTLHVHTAGSGKGYTLHVQSILLVVERDTPYTPALGWSRKWLFLLTLNS